MANDETQDGAQILAVFVQGRTFSGLKKAFESSVGWRHRIAWIDLASINTQARPHADVRQRLVSLLSFEAAWRATLRPTQASPTLLPPSSFVPERSVERLWAWTQNVSPDTGYTVDDVRKLLGRFRQFHRHPEKPGWRDHDERHFAPGSDATPVDRTWLWKLSYKVQPDDFHWDVRDDRGRRLSVKCVHGDVHKFPRYTNIDCHGFIRGGK